MAQQLVPGQLQLTAVRGCFVFLRQLLSNLWVWRGLPCPAPSFMG